MFSLIITIISIALVAALALATIYYGGSAFNRGSAGAVASQLINEGQQVNGAIAVASADAAAGGSAVTTMAGLVSGGYLTQAPATFAATTTLGSVLVSPNISLAVCQQVETRAGRAAPASQSAAPATLTGVYGCVQNGSNMDFNYAA